MGGVLSQSQIDALLKGMLSDSSILPENETKKTEPLAQSGMSVLEQIRMKAATLNLNNNN